MPPAKHTYTKDHTLKVAEYSRESSFCRYACKAKLKISSTRWWEIKMWKFYDRLDLSSQDIQDQADKLMYLYI